jgi:hypothetical protein
MKTVINTQPFFNSSGEKILEYISPTEIALDLLFIMTVNKRLSVNMPYLKVENKLSGNDIVAIRLLDFNVSESIITLSVQELEGKKTYSLEWNMDYTGSFWLWSLTDFPSIYNISRQRYNIK